MFWHCLFLLSKENPLQISTSFSRSNEHTGELPSCQEPGSPAGRYQALLPLTAAPEEKQTPGISREGRTQNLQRCSGVHTSVHTAAKSAGSDAALFEAGQVSKGHELSEEAGAGNASSSHPKPQTEILPFVSAYGQP